MMPDLTCVLNPLACAQEALFNIPIGWLLIAVFLVGLIIGAAFRWGAVAAFVVMILVNVFGARTLKDRQQELPFDDLPKQRKPQPKPKRKTLKDLFKVDPDG